MKSATEMRLLIVDDNPANVALLEQVLAQGGYTDILSTQDSATAPALCRAHAPDLVLLDLHMPGFSGFEVLADLRELLDPPESLPVLVLTADASRDARHRALAAGARDFVTKPIDPVELLFRVSNLLRTRELQQQLESRNEALDEAVRIRTVQLEQARLESLVVLATMAEYHDYATANHTQRVGMMAALIAQSLDLPDQFVATIQDAALLHDVGKVGVSDRVLLKPGRLTPDERATMMSHVEIGGRILGQTRSPVLRAAAEIARTHHEHWNGGGYLLGLQGEEIPLAGRITAVADVFDALIHERPYKAAWELDRAIAEIVSQSGRQFDPRVVEAFTAIDLSAIDLSASANGSSSAPGEVRTNGNVRVRRPSYEPSRPSGDGLGAGERMRAGSARRPGYTRPR